MKPDAAMADRRQSVREAGLEWFRAGWIDENACKSIAEMYPDDRVRVGPVFRILFFVLTLAAIMGAAVALYSLIDHDKTAAVLALAGGLACWVITNHLIDIKKRRQGGMEAAFSLAAIINLMIGVTILFLEFHAFRIYDHTAVILLLLLFALICGTAAWVWGYWPYMALSAALLFCAVITLPAGRLLWIVLLAAVYPWLVRGCDSGQMPPALRKCSAAFLAVSIVALYEAVNVWILDRHVALFYFGIRTPELFPRWLSIGLTATLPAVVLGIGIAKRRRLFLVLGFGLALLSFVTLRMYVHVAPPWVILGGAGSTLLVAAGALRRFLESGTNEERAGFTAEALTERPEKHRAIEILASVATMTPDSSSAPDKPQFRGGGGEFGGGGASGKF